MKRTILLTLVAGVFCVFAGCDDIDAEMSSGYGAGHDGSMDDAMNSGFEYMQYMQRLQREFIEDSEAASCEGRNSPTPPIELISEPESCAGVAAKGGSSSTRGCATVLPKVVELPDEDSEPASCEGQGSFNATEAQSSACAETEASSTEADRSTSNPVWPTKVELEGVGILHLYGVETIPTYIRKRAILSMQSKSDNVFSISDGPVKRKRICMVKKNKDVIDFVVFLSRTIQITGIHTLTSNETNYPICEAEDFMPVFMENDLPRILAEKGQFVFKIGEYEFKVMCNPINGAKHLIVEIVSSPSNP